MGHLDQKPQQNGRKLFKGALIIRTFYELVSQRDTPSLAFRSRFNQFLIKIIDGHSSIKNQALGVDAACALAQQKYRRIGRLLGRQTVFPQCCLFGMQVGIDIAGYARRGRCLEQAWIDGVEPDL